MPAISVIDQFPAYAKIAFDVDSHLHSTRAHSSRGCTSCKVQRHLTYLALAIKLRFQIVIWSSVSVGMCSFNLVGGEVYFCIGEIS